jgi:hypothetical protein
MAKKLECRRIELSKRVTEIVPIRDDGTMLRRLAVYYEGFIRLWARY